MAASSGIAQPIIPYRILGSSDAQAAMRRMLEKATQTFLSGTPVQLDVAGASGYIIGCPTMNSVATAIIAGFASEPGHNLATSGTGTQGITYGSVQNQTGAVLLAGGGPIIDGTLGFHVAVDTTLFQFVVGNSSADASASVSQANIGSIFGLTKDAGNNYWYFDTNITTAAGGACLELVDVIDPVGTLHGKVVARVTKAAQQLFS